MEWLRVKASELSTSSPPVTHDQRQQVLDDLCTRAMTACPSYAVVFEVRYILMESYMVYNSVQLCRRIMHEWLG